MGLDPQQLSEHCRYILRQRRIKGKIVVLCEGDLQMVDGRLSPQTYGRMEQLPDANFYKACVPTWWRENRPEFVTCGDRNGVINTYFTLQALHRKDPNQSFLNPDKLFALVDLDLQPGAIANDYPFPDTEAIFGHLYKQGQVNLEAAFQHRIWTTGLIHKEAYFLAPDLAEWFTNSHFRPTYCQRPLFLRDFYFQMADAMVACADVQTNWPVVTQRLQNHRELDCTNPESLSQSWQRCYQTAKDDAHRRQLSLALLTIHPSKPFWQAIEPSEDDNRSGQQFREQLSLHIAKDYYAKQTDPLRHHLVTLFQTLAQFRTGTRSTGTA